MKVFIVISSILYLASAKPSGFILPTAVRFVPTPILQSVPTDTQFHIQDGFGGFSYGYRNELVFGSAERAPEIKAPEPEAGLVFGTAERAPEIQAPEPESDTIEVIAARSSDLPEVKGAEDKPQAAEARSHHLEAAEHPKVGYSSDPISLHASPAGDNLKFITSYVPVAPLVSYKPLELTPIEPEHPPKEQPLPPALKIVSHLPGSYLVTHGSFDVNHVQQPFYKTYLPV